MALKIDKKIPIKEPTLFRDHTAVLPKPVFKFAFPKEFKKNWAKELDWRFLFILGATFFIEIGLVFFLSAILKNSIQNINMEKIQKQYAQLLLKTEPSQALSDFESILDDRNLTTTNENELINIADETGETEKSDNNKISISDNNLTTHNLTPLNDRKLSRSESQHFSSARIREVSNKGILQYIISGDRSNLSEELSSLYVQGKINSKFLEESVSGLKLVNFQAANFSSADGNFDKMDILHKLKGSQKIASLDDELSSLIPLSKINLGTASKNDKLDYETMSELTKSKKREKARSAEEVTKTIVSHNRAIQDCYKYISKNYPDIKGKVIVRIYVNPNGYVSQVQIIESTLQNDQLLRCIVGRIRRWRNFGECDPKVGTVSYRQTYVFGY